MKIVVLEKQVPDSTEITVDKKTGALIRDGVPAITNPDDLAGLEAALELKDKNPDTEVVVTLSVEKERQKIEVTIPMKGNIIRSEQVSNALLWVLTKVFY